MPSAYMVRLGTQGAHVDECVTSGFVGVDYDLREDLTGRFPDNWRAFNQEFIPVWMDASPGKSKVAAGLACGALWTLGRGMVDGDLVVSPDGNSGYRAGRVSGPYEYVPAGPLPHRRPVQWLPAVLDRQQMSDGLQRSTGVPLTVVNLSDYEDELLGLLGEGPQVPELVATDPDVEDPSVFALEKHLEDFLVANWSQTELGKQFDIYTADGEMVGQQFPTDTGRIDILAVSHDKKTLLVIELKRGRASDRVVGQIQRYMGFVAAELAEADQAVRGAIVALQDDLKTQRALLVAPNIDFYRYEVNFKLHKA